MAPKREPHALTLWLDYNMRLTFYAGIMLAIAGFVWAIPVAPYWLDPWPWPIQIFGHTFLSVGLLCVGFTMTLGEHFRYAKHKKWLMRHARVDALKAMPWDEFERLVGATFKLWGFKVHTHGGNHADGGIDLIVSKRGKRHLVQCKRYKGSVGVPVIREMFGVMVSEKLDGVYLMTSGTFTKECWVFAKDKPIKLISGEALARILEEVSKKL